MIHEGKLSLCEAPPLLEQPLLNAPLSGHEEWIEAQFAFMHKSPANLVADGWDRYDRDFANKIYEDVREMLERDIVNDLTRLQMQPCIYEEYRRFVVIKSEMDVHIAWDRDGVSLFGACSSQLTDESLVVC